MNIGLIGFGSIGERHYNIIRFYSKNITVLSGRDDLSAVRSVKSWRDFAQRGPFDAIFITNETHKHLTTIEQCLKLDPLPKAIFIEKPLATDADIVKSKKIAGSLKKKKVSVWVGYNFHFFKPFLEIKKIIKSGRLGRLYYLRVFVGQDLRVWRKRDYRLTYSGKKRFGGGVMLDLVHDINYPAWLLGEELVPLTAVSGKLSALQIDTEDYAESLFRSKKNGVMVSVHQDYLRPVGRRSLEIVGSNGILSWNGADNEIVIETGKKVFRKKICTSINEMYRDEVRFFLAAVKGGRSFTNIVEAIRDLENIKYLKNNAKR